MGNCSLMCSNSVTALLRPLLAPWGCLLVFLMFPNGLPVLALLLKFFVFFFNDTATTEIYTLSLHDALPIYVREGERRRCGALVPGEARGRCPRSEEHTSELQSPTNLVCRLLLEKKKSN